MLNLIELNSSVNFVCYPIFTCLFVRQLQKMSSDDIDQAKKDFLPPPGWKRNPVLLQLKKLDEALTYRFALAFTEDSLLGHLQVPQSIYVVAYASLTLIYLYVHVYYYYYSPWRY